jgi:hypothetical protein
VRVLGARADLAQALNRVGSDPPESGLPGPRISDLHRFVGLSRRRPAESAVVLRGNRRQRRLCESSDEVILKDPEANQPPKHDFEGSLRRMGRLRNHQGGGIDRSCVRVADGPLKALGNATSARRALRVK